MFETCFRHPETLVANGGSVDVVVLEPEHPKSGVPIVLVPGWAATAEVHKRNAILFAEAGRRTIVLSAPHGIAAQATGYDRVQLAELRKAAAVALVLEAKRVAKADVLTHSEAAIFTTLAALEHPERYRSVIYVAPAGLIGKDSFWPLVRRFNADGLQQILHARKEKGRFPQILLALRAAGKAVASAPLRSLGEVRAIAHAQIQNEIRHLHDQGVKIFVVHPVGDRVFPMRRMNADVWERDHIGRPIRKKEKIEPLLDGTMLDGFFSVGDRARTGAVSDTHNAWYLSPEAYTTAVDIILHTLEKTMEHPPTPPTD